MVYDPAEADAVATELIQSLIDMDTPRPLAIAALCKAIVRLGDDFDLDNACKMIDEFAERSDT